MKVKVEIDTKQASYIVDAINNYVDEGFNLPRNMTGIISSLNNAINKMKVCTLCNELKELKDFNRKKANRMDGCSPWCKPCNAKHQERYYKKNPDKREEHKEKGRIWDRNNYAKNAKEYSRKAKAYNKSPKGIARRKEYDKKVALPKLREACKNLDDSYIKQLLCNSHEGNPARIKAADVTDEMIKLKRAEIQMKRAIKHGDIKKKLK